MAWQAFVSAPVSLDEFVSARSLLVKIVNNILTSSSEPKYRRLRLTNGIVAKTLFPQALELLPAFGFQPVEGHSMELPDSALPGLLAWRDRLATVKLSRTLPDAVAVALGSDFLLDSELLLNYPVCRQWQGDASTALHSRTLRQLAKRLKELHFNDWFHLTCSETGASDPVAAFHEALVGAPLTCFAGGAMRLKRPWMAEVERPDMAAFRRLNPWNMLRVGPYGWRPKPSEPTLEWWAKLCALVTTADALHGREWNWSERSSAGNSLLYVKHIVYSVRLSGSTRVTITMRAIWDSSTP